MNRRDFIKTAGVLTVGLMIDGQPLAAAKENPNMKISAVELYDGGFMMKSFACGGGLPEGSIAEQKLRSSLQNYRKFAAKAPCFSYGDEAAALLF